ncbi:MAG: hypothetical protein ACE5QW_01970 [Thermoplasmata archaeon]
MPTLLIHSLFAAAVQCLVNLVMIGQGINEFTFYAAIASILVDLDHRSDGKRSSIIHSLVSIFLALAIGVLGVFLLADVWKRLFVSSLTVGFVSHVSIDATDSWGIFVTPWKSKVISFFKALENTRSQGKRRLDLILAILSASTLLILVLF